MLRTVGIAMATLVLIAGIFTEAVVIFDSKHSTLIVCVIAAIVFVVMALYGGQVESKAKQEMAEAKAIKDRDKVRDKLLKELESKCSILETQHEELKITKREDRERYNKDLAELKAKIKSE